MLQLQTRYKMPADDSWTQRTRWIWTPNYSEDVDPSQTIAKVVRFRHSFTLDQVPTEPVLVNVSADTRYTLFVNGNKACFGPCRSYLQKWNFETIDISSWLHKGQNVLAVQVLRYAIKESGPASMIKAHIPGFICHSPQLKISSDESWKCCIDHSIGVKSTETFPIAGPFLPIYETIDATKSPLGWKDTLFDDSTWDNAVFVKILFPKPAPWTLVPREIPLLTHLKKSFSSISKVTGDLSLERLSLSSSPYASLIQSGEVTIAPNTEISIDIDAGTLTTGFPSLTLIQGEGSNVDILYAECYESKPENTSSFGHSRVKNNRTDTSGVLIGGVDNYTVNGKEDTYEPQLMRTFRYIQLNITTASKALTLKDFHYYETNYPLEDQTSISLDDDDLQKYWDISRHTLKNCMHETYEDCPYYEQSQFVMDSRAQLLFTYQISRDDRLARKTIHEFYTSLRSDGFLETFFPASFSLKNIPSFSLFWVLMLYDHMLYFGDKALLKKYFGAVDTILASFDGKINHFGMVGRFDTTSWAYVDWVKEWSNFPVIAFPPVYMKNGTIAYVSLLYAYVLKRSAEICKFLGREEMAKEYELKAEKLNKAVNENCFDGDSYVDGPETQDKCQHTQIMAVLSGAIAGNGAKKLLESTFAEGNTLPKCSYAMSFYVFRAFEEAGLYNEHFTKTLMKPYEKMVAMNLTTWAEDDVNQRSDCHGWGAAPLYEIPASVFGLKPGVSGLKFAPRALEIKSAKARLATKFGVVHVEISGHEYKLTCDDDVTVEIERTSGSEVLHLNKNTVTSIVI